MKAGLKRGSRICSAGFKISRFIEKGAAWQLPKRLLDLRRRHPDYHSAAELRQLTIAA
jgi:hypothetical protein